MNLTELAQKSLPVNQKTKDYKELYEETKRNTATFIKLVEEELSKILNQHKKEKAWMEKQIYLLREQLNKTKQREDSKCSTYSKNQSSSVSVGKFEETSKNFLNCEISQISMNQSKSYLTDRKKQSFFNFPLHERQTNVVNKRERSFLKERGGKQNLPISDKSTLNITATLKTLDESKQNFTSSMLLPEPTQELSEIRQRLSKQRGGKKNVCDLKDKDTVTQVLKNIRYKSMTPKISTYNRQDPQYLETNIILPGMFDRPKKK